MFAPKIAKAPTKAPDSPTRKLAPQRPTLVARPFGGGAVEQARMLQRTIGNQATLRYLTQRLSNLPGQEPAERHEQEAAPENMTAREAPRGPSWDFSKIPVFSPDQANSHQAQFSLSAPRLPGVIQPKLVVGQVNDPLEHEADRVADQVMRMPADSPAMSSAPPQISRMCAACEEEDSLQRKSVAPVKGGQEAPSLVHEVLRSPGQPLDVTSRAYFEPRFGRDFSRVRVHADSAAGNATRAVHARAYTVGDHVVFGSGEYTPATVEGKQLLAHELVHVVQQASSEDASAKEPLAKRRRNQMDVADELRLHPTPRALTSSLVLQRQTTAGSSTDPGDCTFAEHLTLQDEVDKWCHGQKACDQKDDCPALWEKIGKFANCIRARTVINTTCYKGGNPGHIVALASAVGALGNCWAQYQKKCKPELPPVKEPVPVEEKKPKPIHEKSLREKIAAITGLTGTALTIYLIISEGSRVVFPPRNLIPAP